MPVWLINLLAGKTPTCKEVIRLLSESMEHPLPLPQRIKIRVHLLICKWCTRYQKQIGFIRAILRRDPEKAGQKTGASLSSEAKERIKETLRRGDNTK